MKKEWKSPKVYKYDEWIKALKAMGDDILLYQDVTVFEGGKTYSGCLYALKGKQLDFVGSYSGAVEGRIREKPSVQWSTKGRTFSRVPF